MRALPSRQRGTALVVSLIMLLLITVLAITSFRLGKSDLQISANMQQRNEALGAAQQAIETAISGAQFTLTPTDAIPNPCNGANTVCVDVNGDGVSDVTVTVNPVCLSDTVLQTSQLNLNLTSDQACVASVNPNSGEAASLCANTLWDTQATATDNTTSAQYVVNEGIAVRVPAATGNALCL